MTKEIKKDMSVIATAILTKVIFKKEKPMEKECIAGLMEKSMMVNGVRESKMDMACGEESSEIVIWDSGI